MSLGPRGLCKSVLNCNYNYNLFRRPRISKRLLYQSSTHRKTAYCITATQHRLRKQPGAHVQCRGLTTTLDYTAQTPFRSDVESTLIPRPSLPATCSGCGALSQSENSDDAGFYSTTRKAVKTWLRHNNGEKTTGDAAAALDLNESITLETHQTRQNDNSMLPDRPVCDRCHNLIYNNKGTSIAHPSLDDIADSIAESPFRRNHVYHILDAADFPMSLIPHIFQNLELAKPRGQNRRAKVKFTTKPTVSFIITRSDLLGPSKEMVDQKMRYFQEVLRSALGRQARDIRLGNVHLVSAKRGWWTKEIKDSIWERGGGNWMVGKVNVGKSNLFPVLFPKGSGDRAPEYASLQEANDEDNVQEENIKTGNDFLQEDSLLPPAQPEERFPPMPVVSHLPGTTASPIRLPFGNRRGELIDLPGLDRGSLERFVQPGHEFDLTMQYRPNVKQHIIKPGQSLLLGGGLVRITPELDPADRSTTLLAYPFVPIDAHVTATDKAIGIQLQQRDSGVKSILGNGAGQSIRSSGIHSLATDVTRLKAGALLRAGVPLSKLPFRVYSADVLIEGVGWVELVCQVRKQRTSLAQAPATSVEANIILEGQDDPAGTQAESHVTSNAGFKPFHQHKMPANPSFEDVQTSDFAIPKIEVFSPEGAHIGLRKPLGAWTLWNEHREQRSARRGSIRPRKSMKGMKKKQKIERRAKEQELA